MEVPASALPLLPSLLPPLLLLLALAAPDLSLPLSASLLSLLLLALALLLPAVCCRCCTKYRLGIML
jgi:hypothetical protein